MADGIQDSPPSQVTVELQSRIHARKWPLVRIWATIAIVAIAAIVISKHYWRSNEPVATFVSASQHYPNAGCCSTFTVLPNGRELLIATRTDSKHEIYVGDFLLETCELTGGRESRSLGFRSLREVMVRARGGRLNFSLHGNDIVLTDWENLRVLDPATMVEKFTLPTPSPRPHALEFSPDGKWLASIPDPRSLTNSFSTNHEVLLWNVDERTGPESIPIEEVQSISFSTDNRLLVCATFEDCLLYDLEKKELFSLTPSRPRNSIAYAELQSEHNQMALVCSDGFVEIWDLSERSFRYRFKPHDSPDGRRPYVRFVAGDKVLISSGIESYRTLRWSSTPPFVHHDKFHQDEMKAWDVASGRLIRNWRPGADVQDLVPIPKSDLFMTIDSLHQLHVWSVQ